MGNKRNSVRGRFYILCELFGRISKGEYIDMPTEYSILNLKGFHNNKPCIMLKINKTI